MTDLEQAARALLLYFESGNGVPVERATIRANAPEVVALRAALDAEAGRVSGWQPIATAPTDGTQILGYRLGRYAEACRVQRDDCEMWQFGRVSGNVKLYPECKPTHWQPLPKPPTDVLAAAQEGS